MEKFKMILVRDWHLMRVARLVIGMLIAVQAFQMQSPLIAFFSAFFLFQALTNTGCCGASGCSVKPGSKNDQHPDNLAVEN
ncbi:MAG: hypothetical protein ACO1NZ_03295 [Adhaeribacter sp.]